MKPFNRVGQIALGWVALVVAQMVAGMLFPIAMPAGWQQSFGWLAVSDVLIVAAIGLVAACSDWKGWKLGVALAAILLGITAINLIEGVVFLTRAGIDWARVVAENLLTYVLVTPVWVLLFGGLKLRAGNDTHDHYRPFNSQTSGQKIWKFVISDFIYVALYLTAGTIIFPLVKAFYATQTVPPMGRIVALQLLLRGPAFIGICLLLVRMLGMARAAGAVTTGVVFTILSGIAPLLLPNPFLPDAVRWVHLGEVAISNFLFGTFVGWIWTATKREVRMVRQAA